MNKQFVFKSLVLIGLSMIGFDLHAQQKGEVQDQEFIIRKDRVLTLPVQPRSFERIPVLPTPKSNANFNYRVEPFFLPLPPLEIKPEAATKNFPRNLEELYPGFAKLGYGNYSSPLLQLRYNIWEDGDYNIGAKVSHEGFYTGPVGGKNSAENHTHFGLDGTLFKDYFSLYGNVDYHRDEFNFYGYDPNNALLSDYVTSNNVLNSFNIKAGISNLEKMSDLNYDANLKIRLFNDRFSAVENEVGLNGKFDFWFSESLKTEVLGNLSLTTPSDTTYRDINRNYFGIRPAVVYRKSGLYLKAGANIIFENDVTDNKKSDFHVFPSIDASYMLSDEFGLYAGFEGDVQRKTYYDFVNENPFLGPSDALLNTIQNYLAKAGVKGSVNGEFNYEVGVAYGQFANMHYYNTNATDTLRFNLLYDSNTRVLNYHAKVNWEYQDWYKLSGGVNYYQYSLTDLEAAFHRPEWEITLGNTIKPLPKLLIQANAHLLGGIVVSEPNPILDQTRTLPVILDLQLKADYKITERFSVFAVGNNLLNQSNQRFLNYPVRGIQGVGGLTVKF
ncbi:TonB-dependent receptor [Belliella kenyensis]|uniref:TonB-dependent receptor n=1 Tax=Belliella kenyensis TaxID=1472724 RepID=A0ABV8ELT7_9BACT|nr:TonB-dependent receptor [Belliella kenyensis]MCH7403764.1 TonB-dependent receptor [Belliella kenyensis]MDN3604432.1 TonB-dependent receptor [Belliella kenyensis]